MIEYRSVRVQWHDEPDRTYWTKVCINKNWTEEEDDGDIFFYFSTIDEYEEAKKPDYNGYEFQIVED